MSNYPAENIVVSDNDIVFKESYKLSKFKFCKTFKQLRSDYPDNNVLQHRSNLSMALEISTHDVCYWLHIKRDRSKDTDVNYPLETWESWLYWTLGWICLILVP